MAILQLRPMEINDRRKSYPPALQEEAKKSEKSKLKLEIDNQKSIIRNTPCAIKILWTILLLISFVLIIWQGKAVLNYNRPRYNLITNDTMILPLITICPSNGINWTAIAGDPALLNYAFYIKQLTGIKNFTTGLKPATNEPIDFTIFELKEKIMKLGYSIDQFMPACGFTQSFTNYIRCSELINEKIELNYGKCFDLKFGADPRTMQTVPRQGLKVTFNLHKELYPTVRQLAPGLQGVVLQVGRETTFLRPGSHYNIDLSAERLILANAHSGNVAHHCVGNGENEYDYKIMNSNSNNYSQAHCISDCYAREIWDQCSCLQLTDPDLIKPEILYGSKPPLVCDSARTEKCIRPRVDDDPKANARVETCRTRCYQSCDHMRYRLKISDAPLNEFFYRPLLQTSNTTIDNIIEVSMAYPTLDYAEIQQDPSISDESTSDVLLGVGLVAMVLFLLGTVCCYKSSKNFNEARMALP